MFFLDVIEDLTFLKLNLIMEKKKKKKKKHGA